MRSLSVSIARKKLPSLLDDVVTKHETIIISRKGKPIAQLAPIPLRYNWASFRYQWK